MTWQEEVELQADLAAKKAYQEGFDDATNSKAIETARKLLEMDISPDKIAKATSLSLEQVLELQKQLQTVKA